MEAPSLRVGMGYPYLVPLYARIRAAIPEIELIDLCPALYQAYPSGWPGELPPPVSPANQETLQNLVNGLDVLVANGWGDPFPVSLRHATRLRWVHSPTAGLRSWLTHREFRERPDIILTAIGGANGVPVAEWVLAAMLSFARDVPRLLGAQQRRIWQHFPPRELYQATVGVVGLGAIGARVAHLCKSFDLTVLGIRRNPSAITRSDVPGWADRLQERSCPWSRLP